MISCLGDEGQGGLPNDQCFNKDVNHDLEGATRERNEDSTDRGKRGKARCSIKIS